MGWSNDVFVGRGSFPDQVTEQCPLFQQRQALAGAVTSMIVYSRSKFTVQLIQKVTAFLPTFAESQTGVVNAGRVS